MILEPGQPCPRCAVRPDVPCKHRAADPHYTPPHQDSPDPADKYRPSPHEGKGFNFGTRKRLSGGGNYGRKGRR